ESTQTHQRECYNRDNECRARQRQRCQYYIPPASFDRLPKSHGISCCNTIVGEKRLLHYALCRKHFLRRRFKMVLSNVLAKVRSSFSCGRGGRFNNCILDITAAHRVTLREPPEVHVLRERRLSWMNLQLPDS